jgi:hypothetical protein
VTFPVEIVLSNAMRLNSRLLTLSTLWLTLVGSGFLVLVRYSLAPGQQGAFANVWPASSGLMRDQSRATLVVVLHPRCPCSRATLSELATIVTRCQDRLSVRVLFVLPAGLADSWTKTDLWRTAQEIPGVVAMIDRNGLEAGRFGALTSGQAVLYDQNGHLAFHGGLTGARGHAGPNPGENSIIAFVNENVTHTRRSDVYGCRLKESPPARPQIEKRQS